MTRAQPYYGVFGGNGIDMIKIAKDLRTPQGWIEKLKQEEPLMVTVPGQPDTIMTYDPFVIEHVISTQFPNYHRYPTKRAVAYVAGRALFGSGIFLADGEIWKFHRNSARPFFFKNRLEDMLSDFIHHGHTVLEILKEHAVKGKPLDIQSLFLRYTLDTFGSIAFGKDFDCLRNPKDEFPKWFDYAQRELLEFFTNPFYFIFPHNEYFNVIKKIDTYVFKLIKDAKAEYETNRAHIFEANMEGKSGRELREGKDLLTMLLSMKDENGEGFSDQFLRDSLLNFVIAGRDTTGILVTWTFYELTRHSEIYDQVLKEIDTVMKNELPTNETLKELSVLDRVIKELEYILLCHIPDDSQLRMMSYLTNVKRFTSVRKGDHIRFFHYFLHRNPLYWDEPERFNPDRWLDPNVIKHKYQYIPFHGGPSKCLGEFMSQKEAKALICMISQLYRFERVTEGEIKPYFTIVSPASTPVEMRVLERE